VEKLCLISYYYLAGEVLSSVVSVRLFATLRETVSWNFHNRFTYRLCQRI